MRQSLVALLLAAVSAPAIAADCLPMFCNFSIKGKKGAFLKAQVKPTELAANDAKISASLTQGRSLASISINRGEFKGTGLKMPETEKALMGLIEKIRAVWPSGLRPPPPVKGVRMIGSNSYSPSARPDNVIVVPLGVLARSKNDDDVVWMLAHEYSHIGLAHFAREAEQKKLVSTVKTFVDIADTAADLSQNRVDTSGSQVRIYPAPNAKTEAMAQSIWSQSRNVGVALEIYNQALSREQEDEADVAGIDLTIAAGYSDAAFGDALNEIKVDEDNTEKLSKSFSAELSSFTEKAMGQAALQVLSGGDMSSIGNNLLNSFSKNLMRIGKDKLINMALATHLPPAKRQKGIGAYVDSPGVVDPAITIPEKRSEWLTATRSTLEYKQAVIAVRAHDCALAALVIKPPPPPPRPAKAGKAAAPPPPPPEPVKDACWPTSPAPADPLVAAFTALQPARATRFADTPLVVNAAARIFKSQNRLPEAERAYDLALRFGDVSPPAPAAAPKGKGKRGAKPTSRIILLPAEPEPIDPVYRQNLDGFQSHLDLLVEQAKYPRALAVVAEAKSRFGDDIAFLPILIKVHFRTKQHKLWIAESQRCETSEDLSLIKRCQFALLGDDVTKAYDGATPEERAQIDMVLQRASEATRRAYIESEAASPTGTD
ncbi:MAG: M48 family metalloprotease [Polymorphobacter sp.]